MTSEVDKNAYGINKVYGHSPLFSRHMMSAVVLSISKERKISAYITLEPKLGHNNNIIKL